MGCSGGNAGGGSNGGTAGGWGGDGGSWHRLPQSMQSVAYAQMAYCDDGPPSSQLPSEWNGQVSTQRWQSSGKGGGRGRGGEGGIDGGS